jgi:prophage tail gpP-like protein
MGDICTVEIDDQQVIKGYIEDIGVDYSKDNDLVTFGGRDFTGDLVDSSYIGVPKIETEFKGEQTSGTLFGLPVQGRGGLTLSNPGPTEWKDLKVSEVVDRLIKPFLGSNGLTIDSIVATQANNKVIEFNLSEGDTVFEPIMELCKKHAILPISLGDGKLTLTRAGSTQANDTIELGINAKRGRFRQSHKDRFREYWVKGQGSSTNNLDLTTFLGANSMATDELVPRNRFLIIVDDQPLTNREAKVKANWEARTRAGKSRPINYTVQGWVQRNGKVWPLNSKVRVKDSKFDIDAELLISDLNFSIDDNFGEITNITVMPLKTFELIEFPIEEKEVKTVFDPPAKTTGDLSIRPWERAIGLVE